ncbi:hypothetical protein BH09BAC4_BH09BAC4_03800 [soil metagenome]
MALFSGPQFVITLANELALTYWGRQREQVMNKPFFEALPESRGQGIEELLTHVYAVGERFTTKERTVQLKRNGRMEPTCLDFVFEPFRESGHTISGVIVVCVEVTEKVLARHRLEESEARYRALASELEQRVAQRTQELLMANQNLTRSTDNLQQFT